MSQLQTVSAFGYDLAMSCALKNTFIQQNSSCILKYKLGETFASVPKDRVTKMFFISVVSIRKSSVTI